VARNTAVLAAQEVLLFGLAGTFEDFAYLWNTEQHPLLRAGNQPSIRQPSLHILTLLASPPS